jgi:hypothetical protein
MEPTPASLKIFVGDFEVVQVSGMAITLHLGKHVHATIYLPFEHSVQPGDTLPLFTELPHAYTQSTSIQ